MLKFFLSSNFKYLFSSITVVLTLGIFFWLKKKIKFRKLRIIAQIYKQNRDETIKNLQIAPHNISE